MRRRQFLMLLGGAVTASLPLAGSAQQSERVRRVGILLPFNDADDPQVRQLWPAFKERLRELGWVEGRNIQFDIRFTTPDIDRIRVGVSELVASAPELLVVWSNPGLAALMSCPHGACVRIEGEAAKDGCPQVASAATS